MERVYKIAAVPRDGIGHEIVPAGIYVLKKSGRGGSDNIKPELIS